MPVYEFRCPECKTCDELDSPMSLIEHRVLWCIHCNVEMKRVFSAPGVVFRGAGFYRTDSRPAPPEPKKETKTSD